MKKNQFQQRFEKDLKDNYFRYLSYLIALNIVSYYKYYQNWIVNTFLDNFYKDNPKRYATGVW